MVYDHRNPNHSPIIQFYVSVLPQKQNPDASSNGFFKTLQNSPDPRNRAAAARRRQSSPKNENFRFFDLGVARPREDRGNRLQMCCGCVRRAPGACALVSPRSSSKKPRKFIENEISGRTLPYLALVGLIYSLSPGT